MKLSLHLILYSAIAVAAALLADAWLSARRDSQKLSATLAAQNTELQAASDREKQRNTELAAALDAIQKKISAVRTPQQAARELPSALPPLPLPVHIQFSALSPPPVGQASACLLSPQAVQPAESANIFTETETPSATLTIPQPDLQPLYAELQTSRADALQAQAAQQNLSDEKARSTALTRERDAALAAARGGSFFARLKRSAKWFAIGAATGAAATALARR